MTESLAVGAVTLHAGDCLAVLKTLAENSVDSCVTDPPYHLTSIVKRFGAENAAPAKAGKTGAYKRASAGFMGKQWDGGEIAFEPETWAAVYRVLKPGGHLLAFGGTRTYHRLAAAIENAGFEVRDAIMWHYGSGFPKSHDVSKGIDKHGGVQVGWFGPWLKAWRAERGIAQKEIAELFPSKTGGKTGCVANWELGFNLPTPEQFNLICTTFGLPFDSLESAEREVIGRRMTGIGTGGGSVAIIGDSDNREVTAPATESARQWQGFGTALKPATEIICLARKPINGTVAANVLKWGTGALNIDGCRVATDVPRPNIERRNDKALDGDVYGSGINGSRNLGTTLNARWPANVIHDGSAEVVEAFPESDGCQPHKINSANAQYDGWGSITNKNGEMVGYEGKGSAARFFYSAKADSDDRLGSKHPTVKPLDLMQYLVRLVTPPKGLVLDPFAGTGTTGEAAIREGMRAILIEREEEYQNDIRRRMKLAMSGPDERKREAIKAKLKDAPPDHGPLFGVVA